MCRYATFMQQLPASENLHDVYPGEWSRWNASLLCTSPTTQRCGIGRPACTR
ncbi:hypothetical protein SON66_10950 [Pseudomonas syringae]|nr:hypothetical protein [Pseudomonas syringae]MDY2563787.1 hypothetical protein [Pseudomonas syringae]